MDIQVCPSPTPQIPQEAAGEEEEEEEEEEEWKEQSTLLQEQSTRPASMFRSSILLDRNILAGCLWTQA